MIQSFGPSTNVAELLCFFFCYEYRRLIISVCLVVYTHETNKFSVVRNKQTNIFDNYVRIKSCCSKVTTFLDFSPN